MLRARAAGARGLDRHSRDRRRLSAALQSDVIVAAAAFASSGIEVTTETVLNLNESALVLDLLEFIVQARRRATCRCMDAAEPDVGRRCYAFP